MVGEHELSIFCSILLLTEFCYVAYVTLNMIFLLEAPTPLDCPIISPLL